ncbi:MAG: PD-(D/E)XK nuclease family protein, partial [Tepidisphaeraceae bacterium]
MSARFILGPAGSGKSRWCFDRIVEAARSDPIGPGIYWITPKQATFMAERELACASGLGAFCRIRVVSFESLGREILNECGAVAIPELTRSGRQMLLGQLLRRHEKDLKFFGSSARRSGLAVEIDRIFSELERCGTTAQDVAATLADTADGPGAVSYALSAKLRDLALLHREYAQFIGQDRLDPHRRLTEVLSRIDISRRVRGADFYVDGFYDLTERERVLTCRLARAGRAMHVTLTLDPDSPLITGTTDEPADQGLFFRTEQAYRRLRSALEGSGIRIEKPIVLTGRGRFANETIAELERGLRQGDARTLPRAQGVELIEASNRREEVDAAARKIRELAASGMRLRDIAVLARDLDEYQELLDVSFREHRIPFFVDRRRQAAHHPLVRFVRALPVVALHNWDHDAVMVILKTALVPLGEDEPPELRDQTRLDLADELENFVLRHRIRGGAWQTTQPWNYSRETPNGGAEHGESALETQRMDRLRRRIAQAFSPVIEAICGGPRNSIRCFVASVLEVLNRCGVEATLARWIETAQSRQRWEEAAEHAQVWNELIELLDQMNDLLGDAQASGQEFLEILEVGLEDFDLALTPPTVDQVLIGQVDRTRTPTIRAAIILGMVEGGFPRRASEDSIFSDSDRHQLLDRRIEVEPDSRRRLFDERFLFYIALTRASEQLIVMRPLADDAGRALA